ncbi:MAG: flagellar L-ring protein precursor FlgH [Candidatus Midichloriaceae bacterium]|jgi:flagellar L-ring protein precursor FlgH
MNLKTIFVPLLLLINTSCSVMEQIKDVGKAPKMNGINVYDTNQGGVKTHKDNMDNLGDLNSDNSLWTPDSKNFFFRERKAKSVGDILKVKVVIQEQAKLDNKTTKSRNSSSDMGIAGLFGLSKGMADKNKNLNPTKLIDMDSSSKGSGNGKIDRKENIKTTIAATIVKILPNGNFIIKGSQEIRVNFELREITVAGIVRVEDITSDNSIDLDQIAEARVSYGGRGQITQYQQDPYGKQILDIISPF